MDAPCSPLEFRLLNDYQRDFPLVPSPYAHLANRLRADEATVLVALRRLSARGAVSRVGAVFAPRSVGASTLAAISAPPERLEEIAAAVSARPGVNHNYQREHCYNLWFVATAPDESALARQLDDISAETGCPVLSLPLEEEYHIDLGFDLAGGVKRRIHGGVVRAARPLAAEERALVAALQPGLELVTRPFASLAARVGMAEGEVLARIAAWTDEGLIKRFGIVVRHQELGYRANAMVVFDVPDAEVSGVGARLAQEAGVTLCYRRRRRPPAWPHNLFCMVHGRSREEVEPVIGRLRQVARYPSETLFSTRRFKQCGARYLATAD